MPLSAELPPPRPWALRVLLVGAVGVVLCAAILDPRVLVMLGLPDYGRWFLDSYAILASNDAVRAGLDPYAPNPLDFLHRGHVYSDWWLQLRQIGLTRQDNFAVGAAWVLAFLGVALATLRPRSRAQTAVLAALLLSPPVLLAINRANNDLLVFALVGLPLALPGDGIRSWRLALTAAALVLATGLKYYPVAGLAALLLFEARGRRFPWWSAAALGASVLVLWTQRQALGRGIFDFPDTVHVFGSAVIFRDTGLGRFPVLAATVALLVAFAVVAVRRGWTRGLLALEGEAEQERWMFGIGSCLLLACFLAGTNFAYRLICALWLCPWLCRQESSGAVRAAQVLLPACLWADGLYCLVLNTCFSSEPPYMMVIWRYLTQPLGWLLMGLLAGWLLEGLVSVLRSRAATR